MTAGAGANAEGNARLTGSTAALLLVLLAAEGATIPFIGPLLGPHVVIGLVLVPPVVVKIAATGWRFARYYAGDREYVRRGPPPALLRLLGPFVVVLTVAVFASGIALLFASGTAGRELRLLHKASFLLWFAATAVHVIGHVVDTARLAPRDWYGRARRDVAGAGRRQWLLVASVAAGVLLAVSLAGRTDWYRSHGRTAPRAVVGRSGPQVHAELGGPPGRVQLRADVATTAATLGSVRSHLSVA